jgi:hypothetical protein
MRSATLRAKVADLEYLLTVALSPEQQAQFRTMLKNYSQELSDVIGRAQVEASERDG